MSISHSISHIFCSNSSQQRRLTAADRQANEIQNYRRGRLHNLPAEILLQVGESVSGLALTALSQTCRKFRAVFTQLGETAWVDDLKTHLRYSPPYFDGEDLSEHRLAIRRDRYYARCEREAERHGRASRGQRQAPPNPLCSCCMQKHPRSRFSDEQLHAEPVERVCRAAEMGGLQSCNHLIMPFAYLQRLRLEGGAVDSHALSGRHGDERCPECPTSLGLHFCTESRRRDFLHPVHGSTFNAPLLAEPARYTEPWTYKLVLSYTILRLPPGQPAMVHVLAHKLRTLDAAVCPHIDMNSPEVLRSIYPGTVRAALLTGSTVRWINDFHSHYGERYRWSKICACKAPGCDTKFRFALDRMSHQRHSSTLKVTSPSAEVCLVVQRDVGRLEDPNDPRWTAQRVVPLGYAPPA